MKVLSHLIRSTTSVFLSVRDYYIVGVNWLVRRRKAVHRFRSRMKKKRWLWCFHWREVWCCIISSWTKSTSSPKSSITKIRGPLKTTASFQKWTPWTCADKRAHIYLPNGQVLRFQHGWLKISNSHGYPHYDWVDQVLGRSLIQVLFWPKVA